MFNLLDSDPQIPIAARSIQAITRHVGPFEPVPGTRDANALLVEPGDHRRQVWVRSTYTGYRAAFFRIFLPLQSRVDVNDVHGLHVDHIFNRARASIVGYEYVRLILCPQEANERHGRFLERRLTEMERRRLHAGGATTGGEILFASNWTIAKMAGVAIDRTSPTYDQDRALRWLRANNFI